MRIFPIKSNQNNTKKQTNFLGLKIIGYEKNKGFQALIKASQDTISELSKKYDVKMVFKEKIKVSHPGGCFKDAIVTILDRVVKLELRDLDLSKSKMTRLINKKINKTFTAEASILSSSALATQNKTHFKDHPISLTPWLKEQEIKFLALKEGKNLKKKNN